MKRSAFLFVLAAACSSLVCADAPPTVKLKAYADYGHPLLKGKDDFSVPTYALRTYYSRAIRELRVETFRWMGMEYQVLPIAGKPKIKARRLTLCYVLEYRPTPPGAMVPAVVPPPTILEFTVDNIEPDAFDDIRIEECPDTRRGPKERP